MELNFLFLTSFFHLCDLWEQEAVDITKWVSEQIHTETRAFGVFSRP